MKNIKYQSNKITITGESSGDRSQAASRIAKYQVGASVPVFYNPDNPAEAVLERGISAGMWVFPVLGTLVAAFGSFILSRR